MKLFGWLKRAPTGTAEPLTRWRATWTAALETTDTADVARLTAQLYAEAAAGADVEVEREMLDALAQLRTIQQHSGAGTLPLVETQHRVVGTEACYFAAPASLAADAAHASGRLLMTATRAIFVGSGRTSATPWHSVHEIVRLERDVLLLRADQSPAAHFRFNTYGDAVVAAFLVRHFRNARRARL